MAIGSWLLSLVVVLAPTPVYAASTHIWEGQYSPLGQEGVDGYIRQSGANLADCSSQAILSWVGVAPSGAQRWVQIGQTQGDLLGNCSPSDVRIYAEQQDCAPDPSVRGARYALWDFGKPPTPNYPVYVNRVGWTAIDPCTQGTDYAWAFRIGSFTSSPKAHGWILASSGYAEANQELIWVNSQPDIGSNHWGLNHSGQVQSGYQLSLYQYPLGNWSAWVNTRACITRFEWRAMAPCF